MTNALERFAHGAVTALSVAAVTAGCAAAPKSAQAPEATSPAAYGQAGYPQSAGAQPAQPAQPSSPSPSPSPTPSTPAQPGGGSSGATSRSMALQGASNEVESSQRELDVAGGDCRNACRALGSMDRAAGRLCELSQGSDEGQRCDDAKRRVYSARDRVKTTCGACPNGPSVERSAPIPSLR
ncbi:MAG: hypothetical protein JWP87_6356 [Labilithrix sp.]|nr:hypothetical protein [Labilithrix sp.]